MTEESKFIIAELNKVLSKNYNLPSFENSSKEELLQIVCDVLVQLEAMTPVDAQKNPDNAIVMILEALQNIKYSPSSNVRPEEFRDGIALGNRSIIRPILFWVLSNPEKVKKRAYLSRYVEKVECPPEMLDDMDVRLMRTQYETLIEEFWKTYNENTKEKKNAMEAVELQHDIAKMEEDTSKLVQRIEQQKEKVESIPNKDVLLAIVRAYRNEVKEQEKLEQQVNEQRSLTVQMDNEIRERKNKLMNMKTRHIEGHELIQQIMDEVRTNAIIENQLPQELKTIKKEYEACETVLNGPEVTVQELKELNNEITKISEEIETFMERKMNSNTNSDDSELGAYRNQAAIVANKKQEISNVVMDLKNQINIVDKEIGHKENVLTTLVGGPLLQGENLKKYVAKLREHNIIYKEYKNQLRALTTEVGVLTRTLDVLRLSNPAVEEMLKKDENKINEKEEQIPDDTGELKIKVKRMNTEIDQVRAETAQIREELRIATTEVEPIFNEYNRVKETFEEVTGPTSNRLKEINNDIAILEEQIKDQEEKWKVLHQQNERKEELVVRLSEDIINTADGVATQPTQINILNEKLAQQEKLKKSLKEELSHQESQKAEGQEHAIVLEGVITLLKAKLECPVPY